MSPTVAASSFDTLWAELLPVGRDPGTGGYRRYAWTPVDLALREWFVATAEARGLDVDVDRNGNLWAWWGPPGGTAFGSHLDSVPDGGAYDGPLGIVSAFAAVDALQAEGYVPRRGVAVAAFTDEEGARFGLPCLGSRLATGASTPDDVLARRDRDGVTFAEALRAVGRDPAALGPDVETLARVERLVELHVEQGRALDVPLGAASAIIPHGRWRFEFTGRADHAGTTRLADRRDPMLPYASTVLAGRQAAARHGALATVGRVEALPGATNAVPASVAAWLDARAEHDDALDAVLADVTRAAQDASSSNGVVVVRTEESRSPAVTFDPSATAWLQQHLGELPVVPTGAGHDAGVLSRTSPDGTVVTGMLFVRNPTGVSHSPEEHAERADCLVGVEALVTLMRAAGDGAPG